MQEENMKKKNRKKGTRLLLHILQHGCLTLAAVFAALAVLGAYVLVDTHKGTKLYRVSAEGKADFEDSTLFNQLLGNSISDIICYGAIRTQMETEGSFDPKKEVDVTAFANRYDGLQREYITAKYYLRDLIDWGSYGFEYEDVYMTGEEVDAFLNRYSMITTVVDLANEDYGSGTASYSNAEVDYIVNISDVSGNSTLSENTAREEAFATILENRYDTVDGAKIENYVSTWDEYYELCEMVRKAAEDLAVNYEEYQNYNEDYDKDNTNVVYYIRRTIGGHTEVYSNQQVEKTELSDLEKQLKEDCNKYIIYDAENRMYETNTKVEEATLRYLLNGYAYAYPEDTQILIGVNKNYSVFTDAFAQANSSYYNYTAFFWSYLAGAVVCMLLYLLILLTLTMWEGKGTVTERKEDRVPTEIMLLFAIASGVGMTFLAAFLYKSMEELLYGRRLPAVAGIYTLIFSLILSFFYYSMVRRIKAGTLFKNSMIKRIYDGIKKAVLYLYDHSTVILRVFIPFGGFVVFHLFICFCLFTSGRTSVVLLSFGLMLLVDGVAGVALYRTAIDRQQILQGIRQINDGDMEHKIAEENLHGDNLVLAEAVNNIGEGIRNAVATSMKDERLKADLITNVSHDIKTPLTSIINYVDLIKRENVENPKVREYIRVLDTKSQRLKQLTDDLVEASKISSGNIVLQWEKINLVELLNQTIGEFSEKFEEKMLTPIFRTGKNSVFIEADSRRIWRVIENLFNNIFKYALTGTRVYIDLKELQSENGKNQVTLTIMNISANPIKVNADELTERFIRGDESRTTEGSGLGLSIARNLTEVQKGKFEITVDGDLFKVILTFPLLEQD